MPIMGTVISEENNTPTIRNSDVLIGPMFPDNGPERSYNKINENALLSEIPTPPTFF